MNKKIIVFIVLLTALLISFISIAANVKIEYYYNTTLDTPSFSVVDNKISQTSTTTINDSTTVDILECDNNIYTLKETGASLSYSSFDGSKNYIILPNTINYTINNEEKTVIYKNEYINSLYDLTLVTNSKYYNNIFDHAKNTTLAERFIFLSDLSVDSEITITKPISITILANLTLEANLNIINSYAGNYDITLGDNYKITSDNNSKIVINQTKTTYKYSSSISNDILTTNNTISLDLATYFISSYMPSYLVSDIYLPEQFISSSIKYEYKVIKEEKEYDFVGNYEAYKDYIVDNKINIKVYIINGDDSNTLEKDIIIGNSLDSLKLIIESELSTTNSFCDYDLLYLINSLDFKTDLTFKIGTGFDIEINNNKITEDTTITYNADNACYSLNNDKVTSIKFRRISLEESEFTLNLNNNDITINLKSASKDEIVQYINSYLHTYVLTNDNLPYSVLNITDNYIYLGKDTKIIKNSVFTDLTFKILDTSIDTETEISDFTYDTTNKEIKVTTKDYDKLYLVYYDNGEEIFRTKIVKSLNSSAGDNTDFESNNPFDSLFTDSTNWLNSQTFEMPDNYSSFYANISVVTVNSVSYNTSYTETISIRGQDYSHCATHNMITVSKGETYSNDTNYAKNITLNINPDYIPNYNSIILIKCDLYNLEASSITATHTYTFTIPGILKCGSNTDLGNKTPNVFSSSLIYNDILDYLKTNNHSSYYSDNYILTNVKYLDNLVLENSGNDTNDTCLDGIEYFTNTKSITIKNYNLSDITAFKYLNNSNLDILNLSNDSITSAILGINIYNLRLKTLDLSGNNLSGISSFKGIFFRTITNLNLSNCKLKTITGLDNVVYIEELNISNNNIDHFESLKNLEYLKNVYLYSNTLDTNSNNYYGTDGLINKVVYYWIYKTSNVNVYVTEKDIFSFTDTEETRLLHLNAIVIPTRMSSAEKTTLTSSLTSAGFSVISFTDTQDDSTHGRLVVSYTLDDTTSYREFYYEVLS